MNEQLVQSTNENTQYFTDFMRDSSDQYTRRQTALNESDREMKKQFIGLRDRVQETLKRQKEEIQKLKFFEQTFQQSEL